MKRSLVAAAMLLALTSAAEARPHHRHHHHHHRHHHRGYAHFPWCGAWMQQHTGITSRATGLNLNRAIEWRHVGSAASGPCVGCLMVEPHHISQIVEVLKNGEVVAISGNDGNAVRTRPRSTRRAVAFRRV